MVYLCCGKKCGKSFSTTFNRNKHEKVKGLWPEKKDTVIEFNKESRLFVCPTTGYSTTSQYRSNIVEHLKSCYDLNIQRKAAACPVYKKGFVKKPNKDMHLKQCHSDPDDGVAMSDIVLNDENELPTIVLILPEQISEIEADNEQMATENATEVGMGNVMENATETGMESERLWWKVVKKKK